jgi:hypothetical protein
LIVEPQDQFGNAMLFGLDHLTLEFTPVRGEMMGPGCESTATVEAAVFTQSTKEKRDKRTDQKVREIVINTINN